MTTPKTATPGPCTQAELDAFEGLDSKSKQLFQMWVDRALKAETELAARCDVQSDYELADTARFLLDRLDEFDPGDDDAERDFHGHVAPAMARLRSAVSSAEGK